MTTAPDQATTHRIQEQQQQQQQRRRGSGQRTTTRQWQRQREPDAVMVKHDPCLLFLPPLRLLQLLLRRPLSPSFSFSSPQSRLVFLLLSYWPHLCFSLFLLLLNATVLAPNPGGGEGGGGALSRKGAAFRSCSWDLLRRNGRKFLLSPQFEWRFPRWVGSPCSLLGWFWEETAGSSRALIHSCLASACGVSWNCLRLAAQLRRFPLWPCETRCGGASLA